VTGGRVARPFICTSVLRIQRQHDEQRQNREKDAAFIPIHVGLPVTRNGEADGIAKNTGMDRALMAYIFLPVLLWRSLW
jgi:hypothetical protein